jgi:arginyl-tRNA synthetase
VITRDLRLSLARAAADAGLGTAADPGLRPAGRPGRYASSIALGHGLDPREPAAALAAALSGESSIAQVEVTGPGYLAITITPEALAAVAAEVSLAGPACVTSDARRGTTVPAPPPGDPLATATWNDAQAALAAALTARLAAAAGAAVADRRDDEREFVPRPPHHDCEPAAAVAFAGRDAVVFTLARVRPDRPVRVDRQKIARHVLANPAYAVRYAHARAASGMRWAATAPAAVTSGAGALGGGTLSREAAALLDALSWLPERVATAARRGRPDEFARYLEDLARVTVDCLSSGYPGSDRLALASAARTGLAAGLGLLGISAPERLLDSSSRGPGTMAVLAVGLAPGVRGVAPPGDN